MDVNYEMPWRPNYELHASTAWMGAAGLSYGVNMLSTMPPQPFYWMMGICGVMAMRHIPKAVKLSRLQKHLGGRDLAFMKLPELQKLIAKHPSEMWLGYGFTWEQRHCQRAFEILKRDWSITEQFDRRRVSKNTEPPLGQTWIHGVEPQEEKIYQPLKHAEGHTLIVGTTGSGKAQPIDSKVHSPSGWRLMGDIVPGDDVSLPCGGTAKVAGVYPQGKKAIYNVQLEDGRTPQACDEHLWPIYSEGRGDADVISTQEVRQRLQAGTPCYLPLPEAVEKPSVDTRLEPYLVGNLLGIAGQPDAQLQMTAMVSQLYGAEPSLDDPTIRPTGTGSPSVAPEPPCQSTIPSEHVVRTWLSWIGSQLAEGSIAQRSDVLSGWLDTAAHMQEETVWVPCQDDGMQGLFQSLVRSLGGIATASGEGVSIRHPRLHHFVRDPQLQNALSRLPLETFRQSSFIRIDAIRWAGQKPAQCLYVDHPSHLYITDDYTVTHNTRMFDVLISQAVLRGEAVIIIDPKGDKELRDNARKACEALGQPERMVTFHPGFPEESVRIDPLRNFTRITEIASRIAALIPSESGADPFTAFGWQALNNIAQGLMMAYERPTLRRLRRFLEGGAAGLVIKAITAYCDTRLDNWETTAKTYLDKAKKGTIEQRALMLTQFYYEEVQPDHPSTELEGLLSMFEHDGTHFSKMVANLLPIMNMLTSGELGSMLSPDYDDKQDTRPVLDTAKIINEAKVAYIGLDSLTDNVVASAIGSMFLADLTAVAGDRYNYGVDNKSVNLFVDEAAEVISDSLITLLNKGRGSKFRLFVATQTFADFAARMGSQDKALQVLGNINNTLALRVKDTDTQEYIVKGFPTTRVQYVMRTQGQNTHSDEPVLHGGNQGERLMEEESELFPSQLLGMLPNLEFIGNISGGKLIKGRLPILVSDKD
ncbi:MULTISPECIES: conjugative transfer system coupling protein TraD [Halomonas]|uniref:conjugative transfer system coupling protein TraD n=1 Tax=Halomonas TaxID=2745 RepID=UPI00299F8815|nr:MULTISPECIES: conjugative transfer system coupling protein TraD [Halomonas]